jgi:nucleolar protein 6
MGGSEQKVAFKAQAKEIKKAEKKAKKEKLRKVLEESAPAPIVIEEPVESQKDKKKKRKLESDAEETPKKSKKSKKSDEPATDRPAEVAEVTESDKKKDKKSKKDKKDKKEKKEKKEKKSKKERKASEEPAADDVEPATKDTMQRDFIAFDTEPAKESATNGVEASKKDKKKSKKDKKKSKKDKKAKKETNGTETATNGDVNGATNGANGATTGEEEDAANGETAPQKKERFIVFVGNLPFTATKEDLAQHFAKVHPASIRLMTDKSTGKSKGFCFLDFDGYDKMKTCLKLYHHSVMQDGKKGRKINVELTAGGGGNTDSRKAKIQTKNEKLHDERQRRREHEEKQAQRKEVKEAKSGKGKDAEKTNGAVQPPADDMRAGIHPSRLRQLQF